MTYLVAFQQVGRWSYASNLIRASETCGLLPDLTAGGWVGLGWFWCVDWSASGGWKWTRSVLDFGWYFYIFLAFWMKSSIVLASCVSCAGKFLCRFFLLLPTRDRICQPFHLFSLQEPGVSCCEFSPLLPRQQRFTGRSWIFSFQPCLHHNGPSFVTSLITADPSRLVSGN